MKLMSRGFAVHLISLLIFTGLERDVAMRALMRVDWFIDIWQSLSVVFSVVFGRWQHCSRRRFEISDRFFLLNRWALMHDVYKTSHYCACAERIRLEKARFIVPREASAHHLSRYYGPLAQRRSTGCGVAISPQVTTAALSTLLIDRTRRVTSLMTSSTPTMTTWPLQSSYWRPWASSRQIQTCREPGNMPARFLQLRQQVWTEFDIRIVSYRSIRRRLPPLCPLLYDYQLVLVYREN